MIFICYNKCSTCKKAENFLKSYNMIFEKREIKQNPPTPEELKEWKHKSSLEWRKFFNTSGIIYREQSLKDKIPNMTEDEIIQTLSSEPMLVKRPLLIGKDFVLIGFDEKTWKQKLQPTQDSMT